ncbi:MAG: glucosylglycerate hydrolase [Lacisediminihabitans sp.]
MDSQDVQMERMRTRAVEVLCLNDIGTMTTAAPNLYPHMWSWDAAFVAIGLARVSVPRAIQELRTLINSQWASGMIPHIVFSEEDSYFPDVNRWATGNASPPGVRSSGICQPPVHAIALRHLLDRGRERGGADREAAEAFVAETFGKWYRWHRWLGTVRDPDGSGLVEIHHGWESGMDNSPRFDEPYSRVVPGDVAPFQRADTRQVTDYSQRPSDEEYTRYLWLVQQMAEVNYDDARVAEVIDFRVKDVFFSAVLSVASDVLADIGDEFGRTADATWLRELARRCSTAVDDAVDDETGLATDLDVLTGERIRSATIAGFAPLLSSRDTALRTRSLHQWRSKTWLDFPALAYHLPPSTSPTSSAFRPRTYWRGPVWPVMNWLYGWALRRHGEREEYTLLRSDSLAQLKKLEFAEYYEPFTNEPLGSLNQAWTAAVALEWISSPTDQPE